MQIETSTGKKFTVQASEKIGEGAVNKSSKKTVKKTTSKKPATKKTVLKKKK